MKGLVAMKIIDAFWEKKNLGVDTTEIVCDGSESYTDVEIELSKIKTNYSVLKIPTGNYDLLNIGQKYGYSVIEVSFKLIGNVNVVKLPTMYNRFIQHVKVEPATDEIKAKVLNEIAAGEIFSTDRIAIDPLFSKELAGKRYCNWCNDAIEKGANLEIAYYKNSPVAFNFNALPDERKICDGLLGGVFSEALDKGLGFLVLYTELESCKKMGGKSVISTVSSNNLPILKLHTQFGFDIKEMKYVLIKHQ